MPCSSVPYYDSYVSVMCRSPEGIVINEYHQKDKRYL